MSELKKTESTFCLNCEQEISPEDKFCTSCGQKNTDGKITVSEMLHVFFDSIFTMDSRFFQTLKTLFRPGRLTNDFFKGKHRKYIHPVRLFLVSAILFFTVFNFSDPQITFKKMSIGGVAGSIYKKSENHVLLAKMDTIKTGIAEHFTHPEVKLALDSLKEKWNENNSVGWENSIQLFGMHLSVSDKIPGKESTEGYVYLTPHDVIEKSVDEIIKEKNITNLRDKIALKQFYKLTRESASLDRYILGNLSMMILLMMPVLALILKLVYIRRKRLYIEHLVFSFHTHSFSFIIMGLAFLTGQLMDSTEVFVAISIPFVMVYLFMALRKVYGQGWIKTFIKFVFLNFAYFFVFILAFVATIAASFYLF